MEKEEILKDDTAGNKGHTVNKAGAVALVVVLFGALALVVVVTHFDSSS